MPSSLSYLSLSLFFMHILTHIIPPTFLILLSLPLGVSEAADEDVGLSFKGEARIADCGVMPAEFNLEEYLSKQKGIYNVYTCA